MKFDVASAFMLLLMSFVPRVEVCNLCFDWIDHKLVYFDRLDPDCLCFAFVRPRKNIYFDPVWPRKNISTKFDRGKTFRPSSTEEKHFDQVRPRKNISTKFDRGKTFRPCSTEEKHFNQVRPRKNISTNFDEEKHFDQVRPRKKVSTDEFFWLTRTLTVSTDKNFEKIHSKRFIIYVCVWIWVSKEVLTYVFMDFSIKVLMYVCMHVSMYECMCVCMKVCLFLYMYVFLLRMFVYKYIFHVIIFVCLWVCMFEFIYICMFWHHVQALSSGPVYDQQVCCSS